MVHAVLMDILGLGVLIVGESGVEGPASALNLIVRGHRLIAADTVELRRRRDHAERRLPELTRNHMEVRGLGVINIQICSALRPRARRRFRTGRGSSSGSLAANTTGWDSIISGIELLGLKIPLIQMPVARVATSRFWSKWRPAIHYYVPHGHHAARKLAERLELAQLREGDGEARSTSTARDTGDREDGA